MLTTVQNCPHCAKSAALIVLDLHEYGGREPPAPLTFQQASKALAGRSRQKENEVFYTPDQSISKAVALLFCPLCTAPTMAIFEMDRATMGFHKAHLSDQVRVSVTTEVPHGTPIKMYPSAPEPTRDQDWPATIVDLFADVQRAQNMGFSPVMVMQSARTVLETCLKELNAVGKNNYERIEYLKKQGTITKPIADWAHDLRKLGNDAAHDAQATAEDTAEFVEFLMQFLFVAFALEARINRRRAAASSKIAEA